MRSIYKYAAVAVIAVLVFAFVISSADAKPCYGPGCGNASKQCFGPGCDNGNKFCKGPDCSVKEKQFRGYGSKVMRVKFLPGNCVEINGVRYCSVSVGRGACAQCKTCEDCKNNPACANCASCKACEV